MDDVLIRQGDGLALAPAVVKELNEFIRLSKEIDEKEKKLKAVIADAMQAHGILNIQATNDAGKKLLVSYVPAYDRETFDSKKFREDHPDEYDEYAKLTRVNPTVRFRQDK